MEDIAAVAHPDIRRIVPVFLKKVIPLLEVLPILAQAGVPLSGQMLPGHLKGENMAPEKGLALAQDRIHQTVDLLDPGIGHGIAADRDAVAMDQVGVR